MLETRDLYKVAYLLCCGAVIEKMILNKQNKITFNLAGDIEKESQRYQMNQALVNPRDLKAHINLLRDQIEERKRNGKKLRSGHQTNY